jgi:hypothetical protein
MYKVKLQSDASLSILKVLFIINKSKRILQKLTSLGKACHLINNTIFMTICDDIGHDKVLKNK